MSREEPSVSQQQFKRCTYMQPMLQKVDWLYLLFATLYCNLQ